MKALKSDIAKKVLADASLRDQLRRILTSKTSAAGDDTAPVIEVKDPQGGLTERYTVKIVVPNR